LPLLIRESGSGSGGGEEWRRAKRELGLGRPGTSFFYFKHCTQFCTAGLQESSHEEPTGKLTALTQAP